MHNKYMNASEIKKIMMRSLDPDSDTTDIPARLEADGISYDFTEKFASGIVGKLFSAGLRTNRQLEFIKYMDFAFYRIALTGIAAIIILLISIFIKEGSLSFNSFLGMSDSYNESIVCLLTGK